MNGVMADSVSAGSSHRGASVTWAAKFIWPSAATAIPAGSVEANAKTRRHSASGRIRLVMPTIVESIPEPSSHATFSSMKFGLFFQAPERANVPHHERYAQMFESIELAESLGFDVAWLAEIHFGGAFSLISNPLMVA